MVYQSFSLKNFRSMKQMVMLSEEQKFDIEVVGTVLPFRVSNYVVDELIDWADFESDPFFILTFPQKEMLNRRDYSTIANLLKAGASEGKINEEVHRIRMRLNPNPAGQESNMPELNGVKLPGIQHKYRETVLFFPTQGQTCHAYCTFCFRWSQFALNDHRFAMKEAGLLVDYLREHTEISDVLITGGDPAVMRTKFFEQYIGAIIDANLPHIKTIRIGTKALTYWPYRFTKDKDAGELLDLFRRVTDKGINLSIMAHFNHPRAMQTKAVKDAIAAIISTGAQIRSQSPLLHRINDNPDVWAKMWREQVNLGITPYYMFIARDTGPQNYFAVTLDKAWRVFSEAYRQVSGVCRTVRGPSMSCEPGKIQVVGVAEIKGEKVFVLNFIQGRSPDWVNRPFFAKYNPDAVWISDLEPLAGESEFFFDEEYDSMLNLM
jgi:KamA family protein